MALDLNQGAAFNPTNLAAVVLTNVASASGSFKVVEDNGTLMKLSNVLAPLDKPMSVKVTNSRIADVYQTLSKGTIPIGNRSLNVSGQSIFTELTAVASTGTAPNEILVPVVCRIEYRLPNHVDVDSTFVKNLCLMTLSQSLDSSNVFRVPSMMRGVLYRGT